MDNNTMIVYIADYDSNIFEDITDYLDYLNDTHDLHLKESECSYMFVDTLTIKHL